MQNFAICIVPGCRTKTDGTVDILGKLLCKVHRKQDQRQRVFFGHRPCMVCQCADHSARTCSIFREQHEAREALDTKDIYPVQYAESVKMCSQLCDLFALRCLGDTETYFTRLIESDNLIYAWYRVPGKYEELETLRLDLYALANSDTTVSLKNALTPNALKSDVLTSNARLIAVTDDASWWVASFNETDINGAENKTNGNLYAQWWHTKNGTQNKLDVDGPVIMSRINTITYGAPDGVFEERFRELVFSKTHTPDTSIPHATDSVTEPDILVLNLACSLSSAARCLDAIVPDDSFMYDALESTAARFPQCESCGTMYMSLATKADRKKQTQYPCVVCRPMNRDSPHAYRKVNTLCTFLFVNHKYTGPSTKRGVCAGIGSRDSCVTDDNERDIICAGIGLRGSCVFDDDSGSGSDSICTGIGSRNICVLDDDDSGIVYAGVGGRNICMFDDGERQSAAPAHVLLPVHAHPTIQQVHTANRVSVLYSFYFKSTQQDKHERTMRACLMQLWGHIHSVYSLTIPNTISGENNTHALNATSAWFLTYTQNGVGTSDGNPENGRDELWWKFFVCADIAQAAQNGVANKLATHATFAHNTALIFAFVEGCMLASNLRQGNGRDTRATSRRTTTTAKTDEPVHIKVPERRTARYAEMFVEFFTTHHKNLAIGVVTAMRMLAIASNSEQDCFILLSPGSRSPYDTDLSKSKIHNDKSHELVPLVNPMTEGQFTSSNRAIRMREHVFRKSDVEILQKCLEFTNTAEATVANQHGLVVRSDNTKGGGSVQTLSEYEDNLETVDDSEDEKVDSDEDGSEGDDAVEGDALEGDALDSVERVEEDETTKTPEENTVKTHNGTNRSLQKQKKGEKYEAPLTRFVCTLLQKYKKLVELLGPRLVRHNYPIGTKWVFHISATYPTGNIVSSRIRQHVLESAKTNDTKNERSAVLTFKSTDCVLYEHLILSVGDYTEPVEAKRNHKNEYKWWQVADDTIMDMYTYQDVKPVFLLFCRSSEHDSDAIYNILDNWNEISRIHSGMSVYVSMDTDEHAHRQTLKRHSTYTKTFLENNEQHPLMESVYHTEFNPSNAHDLWERYGSPKLPAIVVLDTSGFKTTPSFGVRVVTNTGWRFPFFENEEIFAAVPRHAFERKRIHRTEPQWFDEYTGTHILHGILKHTDPDENLAWHRTRDENYKLHSCCGVRY